MGRGVDVPGDSFMCDTGPILETARMSPGLPV